MDKNRSAQILIRLQRGSTKRGDGETLESSKSHAENMSKLMLKYGSDVLEKIEREKRDKVHCEETDNVL